MLLVPIPWVKRVWALPFLTALAPSERYYESKVRGHKKLTDWARQMLLQVRRWLPERALVVVADSSFAAILLLERLRRLPNPICMVTRLRSVFSVILCQQSELYPLHMGQLVRCPPYMGTE